MSLLRNLFARSEQWRLEWGCRTCVSVALVAFLYLYGPTKGHLTRYGTASTSFATVVTAFVKDVTIGATITNAWSTILGAFMASFFSWIYFLIVRTQYEDSVPLLVTLLSIFISVFILQYMEMVPVTKKFAVGMIPLNLIGYRNHPEPSFFVWGLFLAVLIGCGCAMVGCIVPLPLRLASTELRDRIEYYSEALSSVVKELSQSWLSNYKYNHNKYITDERIDNKIVRTRSESNRGRNATSSFSSTLSTSPERFIRKKVKSDPDLRSLTETVEPALETLFSTYLPVDVMDVILENPHWRKLRLIIRTISVFKRRNKAPVHHNSVRKFNTRFIRVELVNYLQETLPYLQSRNLETGFGFTRRVGNRCAKYVKLIQDLLLLIAKFEVHVENMEKLHKYHYLYAAFFSRANLQYGLTLYAECIADTILSISQVLVVQSVLDDELLTPGDVGFRAVEAAAKLIRARNYFDAEYLQARKVIFYPTQPISVPGGRSSPLPAETEDTEENNENLLSPSSHIGGHVHESQSHSKFLGEDQKSGLRAHSKAMMEVNSILFLLDAMSRLLLEFWSHEDLVTMSKHDSLAPPQDQWTEDSYLEESERMDAADPSLKKPAFPVRKFINGLRRFVWELFPFQQAHLFCGLGQTRSHWVLTRTIKRRLTMAAKVAVAMTIAAFYGIIANRPSPSLSSLTIAFLAGGAVSGINVMTCINRAAGTAVASVYSIMVAYIVAHWESDLARDIFIGFAVVLIQIPATYVRSFPLYAYSGTVTGFTVALLLLARNVSTAFAVNRIIDTYVAVALYLVLELALAATFTEDELIHDMSHVFSSLQDRFLNFHRNFQFFKAAEDSCAEVQSRIRGGTLTAEEVGLELKRIERLRFDILNRKALEVDSIQALIRRQLQLGPFYRSEPALLRPAMFPTGLLEESITLQQQAVNSIQIMIWAVRTCDGSFDDKVERMISRLDQKIKRAGNSKPRCTDLPGLTGHTGIELMAVGDRDSSHLSSPPSSLGNSRPIISILPEFKSLLLPLEPHFIEVEKFVSAVLTFLCAAMEQIGDWQSALKAFKDPIEIPGLSPLVCDRRDACSSSRSRRPGSMLSQLSAVAQTRYAMQLEQLTVKFPHHIYERLTHGKDDAFNTAEVDRLYGNYKSLIDGLQDRIAEEGAGYLPDGQRGDINSKGAVPSGRIPSNREITIVNTLLTSTQQLISALHGLTSVANRMQAHRDIHVTQDGKRL